MALLNKPSEDYTNRLNAFRGDIINKSINLELTVHLLISKYFFPHTNNLSDSIRYSVLSEHIVQKSTFEQKITMLRMAFGVTFQHDRSLVNSIFGVHGQVGELRNALAHRLIERETKTSFNLIQYKLGETTDHNKKPVLGVIKDRVRISFDCIDDLNKQIKFAQDFTHNALDFFSQNISEGFYSRQVLLNLLPKDNNEVLDFHKLKRGTYLAFIDRKSN